MKKITLIALGVALIACQNKNKAEENSAMPNPPAVLSDAVCLDAKGPVSEMEVTSKNGLFESIYTYKFDEKGELTNISDGISVELAKDDIKMERDAQKRPVKMTTLYYDEMDDEEPMEEVVTFTYDSDNRLTKEEHNSGGDPWSIVYALGEDGKTVEYVVKSQDGESKSTISYPADAVDAQGNWLSRTVTNADGVTQVTRKITYRN